MNNIVAEQKASTSQAPALARCLFEMYYRFNLTPILLKPKSGSAPSTVRPQTEHLNKQREGHMELLWLQMRWYSSAIPEGVAGKSGIREALRKRR